MSSAIHISALLIGAIFLTNCQSTDKKKNNPPAANQQQQQATTPKTDETTTQTTPTIQNQETDNNPSIEVPTDPAPLPTTNTTNGILNPLQGATGNAGFMLPEDIAFSGPINELSESKVLSYLKKQTVLYSNIPNSLLGDNCLTSKMKTQKFQVDDAQAILSGTLDYSECIKQTLSSQFDSVERVESKLTFYISYICNHKGIQELSNKSLADTNIAIRFCKDATFVKHLIQNKWDIDYVAKKNGSTYSVAMSENNYLGDKSGNHCLHSKQQGWWKLNLGCLYISKNQVKRYLINGQPANNVFNDFTQLYFGDLIRPSLEDSDKWYTQGQISVVRNNWAGTLQYQGKTSSPTLRLKNHKNDTFSGFLPSL